MKNLSFTVLTSTLLLVFLFLSIYGNLQQQRKAFTETSKSLESFGIYLPLYRIEITATTIGNNIFVIGGIDKPGKALDTVEFYNIKNESWKRVAPLPQPLHHAAAASFNGKIYVIGGSAYDAAAAINNWIPSNKLFIYDPIVDKWTEGKPMPTARGAMTANFVDGILYVIGGVTSSSKIVNVNEEYDPSSNVWTSKSPMPTARHHAVSAVVDNQLFVVGGTTEGLLPIVNTNTNERYDPKQDQWITLQPMPSKKSGSSAAPINNTKTIYVFGGEDLTKTYYNNNDDDNEKYDVKSNKWLSHRPIHISPYILSAVSINDKIYVIGGGPRAGLTVTNVSEIFNIK